MATAQEIAALYQQQLGREADPEGAAYWASTGLSPDQIASALTQSLEGQNLLTQAATSVYRQELGRNPEQEGYQYWASLGQEQGLSAAQLQDAIRSAAAAEQAQRGITGGFTDMQLAALEADPYGGRYATNSIYDLLPGAVNTSTIGDRTVQFVAPPTQNMYTSQFGGGSYSAQQGQDVLNQPAVQAAISRAMASGTMNQADYTSLVNDITKATNPSELMAAFNKPQGQVVIDAIYGQQTGEGKTLAEAQAEAAQRQAVLDATDQGYYQNNFQLADAYAAAGLDFPFGRDAYTGYDTRVDQSNLLNSENFNAQVNKLLSGMTQQFGTANTMQTPLTGQYYSEAGLQAGYTPVGTEGTTFRSGVAGYVPQDQLPTGFNFGAPPVNATFQQYRPGAFQPSGVTTGGYITGYNANGTPIYSTYADPNQTVGNYVAPQTTQSYTTELVNQILASNPGLNFANQLASQQSSNTGG